MEAGGRLDWLPPPFLRDEQLRVKGRGLRAALGDGGTGRVAIVLLDPFEERLAGSGWDRRGRGCHPFVPTARRYSVTWTSPVTPASTASALRIAG